MELKYAHLADYAAVGERGKMLFIGIFDRVLAGPERPIQLNPFHIAGSLRAYVTEGTEHVLDLRLVNADGQERFNAQAPVKFQPVGGQFLEANFAIGISGLAFIDVEDYAFHILVDGKHLGILPISVVSQPT